MHFSHLVLLVSFRSSVGSSGAEEPKIPTDIQYSNNDSDHEKSVVSLRYNFDEYQTFDTMVSYMKDLSKKFPNITKLSKIGTTHEGRELLLMKITYPNDNKISNKKPAVWIDAGIHAREWIAGAVAMKLLSELVENFDRNADLVSKYVWYVMPMVNPDGNSYTWTTDRLWRKNRSPGTSCIGVDLNRNFPKFWGEAASSDECDETYRGPKPLSEKEAIAISKVILKKKNKIKMYLTLHSYGQLLIFPWGVGDEKPSNYDQLYSISAQAVDAIQKFSKKIYANGQTTDIMYQAGGCSDDWAYGYANISLVYTFELRSQSSFQISPKQINPTFQELFVAIKVMVTNIK